MDTPDLSKREDLDAARQELTDAVLVAARPFRSVGGFAVGREGIPTSLDDLREAFNTKRLGFPVEALRPEDTPLFVTAAATYVFRYWSACKRLALGLDFTPENEIRLAYALWDDLGIATGSLAHRLFLAETVWRARQAARGREIRNSLRFARLCARMVTHYDFQT